MAHLRRYGSAPATTRVAGSRESFANLANAPLCLRLAPALQLDEFRLHPQLPHCREAVHLFRLSHAQRPPSPSRDHRSPGTARARPSGPAPSAGGIPASCESCRLSASLPNSISVFSSQCERSIDRADDAVTIDFRSACMASPCGRRLVVHRDFFLVTGQDCAIHKYTRSPWATADRARLPSICRNCVFV